MKNTREMMRKILYTILYSLAHNTLKLQILLTLKKNFTSNRSIILKMLQEISIIVYYLRTTQFSICHLSLSLPQIHSTQPLYPPIFIHPFNERRSKFQASHPRISFDRELKGIDWITPKAPS